MEFPILSVIIPSYNAENFICRCLDSVLNQSLKNIEIIVVDDRSSDNTNTIIQNYVQKHQNITHIMLSQNVGAGNARNLGLEKAQGDFVCFLDNDDWVDSNLYGKMVKKLQITNCDIAICGTKTEFSNSCLGETRYEFEENIITGSFALQLLSRAYNNDTYISAVVWNKIYKKTFIDSNELFFEKNSYSEDVPFTFFALKNAKKIVLVPEVYYHYFRHNNSITANFSNKHIMDLVYAFKIIREKLFCEQSWLEHQFLFYAYFDKCLSSIIDMMFLSTQDIIEQKKFILNILDTVSKTFPLEECVAYLDNNRVRNFFKRTPLR